ncbi:LysR-family transcriptional regulator [Marinomonas sp. MED121]|uniref:LysR family transcriptional regulator n=1 Tax=Marinomonas sp. MED121 TaxID=314277 RepID=UPI000068FF07|nr:LysR family transcriptional regulator [Marinomonas sp. MED121]EAQ66901.1 LysR-family transcriptional regulator [Marinomonas sp. MED121]
MLSSSRHSVHSLLHSTTLDTFLAVCQHQSFTKAAKALGLGQSSVSQNIQKLEESLGVTLFDREVRPIMLKPEAVMLREVLEGQFAEIEHVVSQIREQNELKPIVKIGVIDSLSTNVAPALIRLLTAQTRQVSVLSGISPNIAQDLLNREVDIIITSDPLDGVEGLSRYFLCQEPHLLVLPKNSELVDKAVTWQQLISYKLPIVRYSRRSASGRVVDTHFSRMRMSVPFKIEADTTRVVLSMVADGLGWALSTPLCLMQCKDVLGDVHLQPAPQPLFSREIYIVTRHQEFLSLVEMILAECAHQLSINLLPEIKKNFPWSLDDIVIDEKAVELACQREKAAK